jgi:hypothetical protein
MGRKGKGIKMKKKEVVFIDIETHTKLMKEALRAL